MKKDEKASSLKKARRVVFWRILFNRRIPKEYHSMMVNLECCSERVLKFYFRDYLLCVDAQVLMVEKYAESKPHLIADFINKHTFFISREMQIKIIESKNIALLQKIAECTSGYIRHFEFSAEAYIALIKLNDAEYFKQVYECGLLPKQFSNDVVTAIIELQNPKLLDTYLQISRLKNINMSNLHQTMLYKQNNSAMIDCFLKRMVRFDASIVCDIIKKENTLLFGKLIGKHKLAECIELFLAKSGSKKMLAQYIKQWPLYPEAQIQLAKRDYKDILKLHYLNHSVSNQALLYVLSLTHFKEYLGLNS